MARRDQSNARKLALLNELTTHRLQIKVKKRALAQQIAASTEQIKDTINVPKQIRKLFTNFFSNKIKTSFTNSPTKWFIGSAIGSLIISKILFSSISNLFKKSTDDEPKIRRSIFFTLLGMAARPIIKSYLIGKAQQYLTQKFLSPQQLSDYDYSRDSDYADYDIR